MKLVCKTLKDGDSISFKYTSQRYGRAEFLICPKYKRGKLVELIIERLSQNKTRYFYKWKGENKKSFFIENSFDANNPAEVWLFSYSNKYKCQSIRLYAPEKSKKLLLKEYRESIDLIFM